MPAAGGSLHASLHSQTLRGWSQPPGLRPHGQRPGKPPGAQEGRLGLGPVGCPPWLLLTQRGRCAGVAVASFADRGDTCLEWGTDWGRSSRLFSPSRQLSSHVLSVVLQRHRRTHTTDSLPLPYVCGPQFPHLKSLVPWSCQAGEPTGTDTDPNCTGAGVPDRRSRNKLRAPAPARDAAAASAGRTLCGSRHSGRASPKGPLRSPPPPGWAGGPTPPCACAVERARPGSSALPWRRNPPADPGRTRHPPRHNTATQK